MAGEPTTAGCRAVASPRRTGGPGRGLPRRRPGGRGPDRRAHQPARVGPRRHRREPVVRDPGEPARPHPRPGRLLQRLRGRGGHRRGGRGLRQRHRRFGADSRRLLRHRRPQDDVGPHPARRRLAAGARASTPSARWRAPWRAWSRGCGCSSRASPSPGRRGPTWPSADCPWRRTRPSPRRSTGPSTSSGGTVGTWPSRSGTTPPCRRASCWWSRPGGPTRRWWREDPEGISDGVRGRLELGGSFDEGTVARRLAGPARLEGDAGADLHRGRPPRHAHAEHLPAAPRGRRRPPRLALHPSGEPGRGARPCRSRSRRPGPCPPACS